MAKYCDINTILRAFSDVLSEKTPYLSAKEIKKRINELDGFHSNEWISVEDRNPTVPPFTSNYDDQQVDVLIYSPYYGILKGTYYEVIQGSATRIYRGYTCGRETIPDVTHWMPLPAPPKKKEA